jgi:WD40 repeat protein
LIFYRYDGDEWVTQQKIQLAHEDTVWNAQFDPSGDYLISVGGDSKLKVCFFAFNYIRFEILGLEKNDGREAGRHQMELCRYS